MGCFDSTCALTRTSIHNGDEIFMVAVRPGLCDSTYDLLNDIWRAEVSNKEWGGLTLIEWSSKQFRFLGFGIYNDYGSVEDFDNDDGLDNEKGSWWDYQFMVHKMALEGVLKKKLDEYEHPIYILQELLDFCFAARVEVFGHNLLGAQYFDRDELELQRKLLNVTQKVIGYKENYIKENWEDDED